MDITQIPDDQLKQMAQSQSTNSPTPVGASGGDITKLSDDELKAMAGGNSQTKPFYDAIGANMTPAMKQDHPILAGIEQTAQDVGTVAEKGANGLSLGLLDKGLNKAGIQPPNFDNTAPENKSGLNLIGDATNLAGANKTLGVIGSKIIAPAAKAAANAVPEGLKQSSYALMQSIVNQLPKEFKYGANAGRAMVKEGFSGDASAIKEQADKRIEEIGGQGDALASNSDKAVNNSNAMKVIDDKIAELQKNSPRSSSATITKLQNAKNDLLKVREGNVLDPASGEISHMKSQDITPENMTPKETLDLKRSFDDLTAWKGTAADDSVFNKTMQQARTQLKDNLNDAVPGMKDWNQRYADLRAAQQAAGRKATYDQANVGMKNLLAGAIRGTVGITTLGAALHGNGELAGEILAGWGAKEVIGNPVIKSKLAQALYGLSEADKLSIFKAAPWIKNIVNNFRQKPNPGQPALPPPPYSKGGTLNAELVDNPIVTPPPYKNPELPSPAKYAGLPNNAVGRRGINPNIATGGLPDPGNTAINQSGRVPPGLPEPFQGRSGVDRPYENIGLPSPRVAGQSSGPVIQQGTSYTPPPAEKAFPKTDFGHQIKFQMQNKENVPLHPAEEGRAALEKIYPPAIKGNPNLAPGDINDFNDMRDWELSQNPGGKKIFGGNQDNPDRTVITSGSGHSDAFKKVSGNSQKVGFDLLKRASNGDEMTPGEKLKIKMMIADFRKNVKPNIS